jgi:hypothetical protein
MASGWWLAYDDGTVWPCEIVGPTIFPGHIQVRALYPAPNAGEVTIEPRQRVYDAAMQHPGIDPHD